jgi:hypothetical protein
VYFSLKTSLLKWRPDFEIAADEYSKAGTFITSYLLIFYLTNSVSDLDLMIIMLLILAFVFIPLMLCYLYFVCERSDMVIFQHLKLVLFFIGVYLFSGKKTSSTEV